MLSPSVDESLRALAHERATSTTVAVPRVEHRRLVRRIAIAVVLAALVFGAIDMALVLAHPRPTVPVEPGQPAETASSGIAPPEVPPSAVAPPEPVRTTPEVLPSAPSAKSSGKLPHAGTTPSAGTHDKPKDDLAPEF